MPQRGRPPQPGTAEEKAAIRREKVRLYVKAHRERKKAAESVASSTSPGSRQSNSSSPPSEDTPGSTRSSSLDSPGRSDVKSHDSPEEQVDLSQSTASSDQWTVAKSKFRQTPAKVTIAVPPMGNKEMGLALLGTFRGQFLPSLVRVPSRQEYGSELVTPCSAWITNAYTIAVAQDSGALKSSLLAVGLALTSMQYQDQRLRMASLDIYRKALRQVRNDIKPLTTGQTTNYLIPYLSCLAAAMFEMVHDGFSENIMQHVKGATSLMELLPRDANVNHLLGDLLLEDLCMWEIVFALKYRYPSPLRAIRQQKGARNYLIDGDTRGSSRNATTLGDLLDCADEISTIMATVDRLKSIPNTEVKMNDLQVETGKLDRILKAFDAWNQRFHNRFGPIFMQVGMDESTGIPIMQFLSYEIAAAWVYYLTFRVCATETQIEAVSEMLLASVASPSADPAEGVYDQLQQKVPVVQMAELLTPARSMDAVNPKTSSASPFSIKSPDPTSERLHTLRTDLRLITAQLVEALCIFLPIPKGIIGSSLVLFPLDRAKAMLKREISRLQTDLTKTKESRTEDDTTIIADLNDMFSSMTIYETLEQTLAQFGMPPMPED